MFMIIDPQNHCFYKPKIDHFIELMKRYYQRDLSLSDQNSSTFIIAEDETRGVYGGALLAQKKVRLLSEKLRKKIDCLISQDQWVWTCTVFLHIQNDDPLSTTDNFEPFCWDFYRTLYKQLTEFGEKVNTGFLCMTLDSGEYLCTEEMGLWPYVIEIKPQESSDRLFHGILSLTGIQYESYLKNWKVVELSLENTNLVAKGEGTEPTGDKVADE